RVERAHPRLPLRQEKGYTHLVRYQRLIERHYREQPSITWMANQLGITATHLNTHCQRLAGSSAKLLLHERVMLEAKRLLTYTNMTISEVAYQLGFSEPAYFTRFFKRNTKLSPKTFRQQRQNSSPPTN
ncbi:MAG: helix-turn-helix domain-containing protein, partial [Pseudomonadota bacterium]|nr:helix-turn-helix domain-containing protein [Pseudomonadota bacterium]